MAIPHSKRINHSKSLENVFQGVYSGVKFNSKTFLFSAPWPNSASKGLKIEVFENCSIERRPLLIQNDMMDFQNYIYFFLLLSLSYLKFLILMFKISLSWSCFGFFSLFKYPSQQSTSSVSTSSETLSGVLP